MLRVVSQWAISYASAMWLFTRHGYFSITRSTVEPDKLQVRARVKSDLENLKTLASIEGEILETSNADYRWRLIITPEQGEELTQALTRDIDYSNFKGSVAQQSAQSAKLHGLHEIWSIHHGWQG